MDLKPLLPALLLALAGCSSDPTVDAAPDAPNALQDAPVDEGQTAPSSPSASLDALRHLRFNTTADQPILALRLTLEFGASNECQALVLGAARPSRAGGWMTVLWQASGEGGHDLGAVSPSFDASGPGDSPAIAYHAGGVLASSSASGDRDVAMSSLWDGGFAGRWDVTIVAEDLHAWPSKLSGPDAAVIDVRCSRPFQLASALAGTQGLIATSADGAGVGANVDGANVRAFDEVGLQLDGALLDGMMVGRLSMLGPGVGVGIATMPGTTALVPLQPMHDPTLEPVLQRTFEGGAGRYAFAATQAALSELVVTFYGLQDEVGLATPGWAFE